MNGDGGAFYGTHYGVGRAYPGFSFLSGPAEHAQDGGNSTKEDGDVFHTFFDTKQHRIAPAKKWIQPAWGKAKQSPGRTFIEQNGVFVERG